MFIFESNSLQVKAIYLYPRLYDNDFKKDEYRKPIKAPFMSTIRHIICSRKIRKKYYNHDYEYSFKNEYKFSYQSLIKNPEAHDYVIKLNNYFRFGGLYRHFRDVIILNQYNDSIEFVASVIDLYCRMLKMCRVSAIDCIYRSKTGYILEYNHFERSVLCGHIENLRVWERHGFLKIDINIAYRLIRNMVITRHTERGKQVIDFKKDRNMKTLNFILTLCTQNNIMFDKHMFKRLFKTCGKSGLIIVKEKILLFKNT